MQRERFVLCQPLTVPQQQSRLLSAGPAQVTQGRWAVANSAPSGTGATMPQPAPAARFVQFLCIRAHTHPKLQ